jgi:hypothetical protein
LHGLIRLALALLVLTLGGMSWADPSAPEAPPPESEAPALESPTDVCARQHETAQVERMADHLQQARDALLACAHEQCPSVIRSDCITWLEEVRALIPTVVFEALGDDGLLTDVEVKLGDRIVLSRLDGRPTEMPVGLADFTFTGSSGEQKTVRILLRQGETNRIVSADFRTPPAPPPAKEPPPRAPEMVKTRPIPNAVWLLGAGTLVALGTGVTLGTVAKAKEGEAGNSCAPDCASGVVSEIKDFALAADIAFGVTIALGVTTTIVYLGRPTVLLPRDQEIGPRPRGRTFAMAPRVLASPGLAWIGVRGRFQ